MKLEHSQFIKFNRLKRLLLSAVLTLIGLFDVISRGRFFRKANNVVLFHEISDTPCLLSRYRNTSISPGKAFRLCNQLAMLNERVSGYKGTIHLTFDDGFKNILPVIDFLIEKDVKTTIFVNPGTIELGVNADSTDLAQSIGLPIKYAATRHFQGEYLSVNDLKTLIDCHPKVNIGDHLYQHQNAQKMALKEFRICLMNSSAFFKRLSVEVRHFAWPYGKTSQAFDGDLIEFGLTEVYLGDLKWLKRLPQGQFPRTQVSDSRYQILEVRGRLLLNRLFTLTEV